MQKCKLSPHTAIGYRKTWEKELNLNHISDYKKDLADVSIYNQHSSFPLCFYLNPYKVYGS